jgi:phosphoribosyl 1,2-cyclic phosphodiesterase
LAYVTDAKSLPADAIALLRGASVLVINALFRTEHPTHLSLPEAVAAARDIGAERTYLTHLTHENFHADLEAVLKGLDGGGSELPGEFGVTGSQFGAAVGEADFQLLQLDRCLDRIDNNQT